jgi:hypothetical protein
MAAIQREGPIGGDPAEFIRRQPALLELAVRNTPPDRREAALHRLIRHEVLGVYDRRFLRYDSDLRRRVVAATRDVLSDWLTDEIRARLPVGYRMRAFCVRYDLIDELERLIRDETEGRREGAVVVGGRIYAVYPYLRGVPRQDADITAEVGVEHRLDAVSWTGDRLRLRGHAAIDRVAAKNDHVEIVLREPEGGAERRVETVPYQGGFEASLGLTALHPGRWDVYVSVETLGLSRQARLGRVRAPGLDTSTRERTGASAYFAEDGHLAIELGGKARRARPPWRRRLARLFGRLTSPP